MSNEKRKTKNMRRRMLIDWFLLNRPKGTLLSVAKGSDIVVRDGVVLRNWHRELGSINDYKGD